MTSLGRRPAVVGFFIVFGAALGAADQSSSRSDAIKLLNAYDRGDHQSVASELTQLSSDDFASLKRDLERVTEPWTQERGPDLAPRRRLVAATVLLEVAHAGLNTEWRSGRSLIELGCTLVRRNPAGEGERDWQFASIALFGGARDDLYLSKHLAHARAQFADEPRLRLAEVVAGAFPVAFEARRRDSPWIADRDIESKMDPRAAPYERARRDRFRTAIRSFGELLNSPEIRGEANLWIGHLLLFLHDPERSLLVFRDAVKASRDTQTTYLAFFLTGQALEALGRTHDAEMAYRQALTVIPNVQTGVEALATLLFLDGNPDEAYGLIRVAFEAKPQPPDVWRLSGFGDYVRWPDLLRRLRTDLK